jgi:8-amino-7-oxononanoate synthase
VSGERPEHRVLEQAAAELVRMPAAIAFTSGYAANLGTLAALAGPEDLIVSDELNHASLIDGARLSRARVIVMPHLDVRSVKRALGERGSGRAFVVTESYFSMDADSPDLRELREACDSTGAALVVDEAHALGVLGPAGRGLCADADVAPDVLIGTFGKAFGASGAFVAGCPSLIAWLWNRARTFVFSTGLSPALAVAAHCNMQAAFDEPHRRNRALAVAATLRNALTKLGLRLQGYGHIIPWIVGDPGDAMRLAEDLRGRGIQVRAIRPPSVRAGTARLRLTATAQHTATDMERLINTVACVVKSGLG